MVQLHIVNIDLYLLPEATDSLQIPKTLSMHTFNTAELWPNLIFLPETPFQSVTIVSCCIRRIPETQHRGSIYLAYESLVSLRLRGDCLCLTGWQLGWLRGWGWNYLTSPPFAMLFLLVASPAWEIQGNWTPYVSAQSSSRLDLCEKEAMLRFFSVMSSQKLHALLLPHTQDGSITHPHPESRTMSIDTWLAVGGTQVPWWEHTILEIHLGESILRSVFHTYSSTVWKKNQNISLTPRFSSNMLPL